MCIRRFIVVETVATPRGSRPFVRLFGSPVTLVNPEIRVTESALALHGLAMPQTSPSRVAALIVLSRVVTANESVQGS